MNSVTLKLVEEYFIRLNKQNEALLIQQKQIDYLKQNLYKILNQSPITTANTPSGAQTPTAPSYGKNNAILGEYFQSQVDSTTFVTLINVEITEYKLYFFCC